MPYRPDFSAHTPRPAVAHYANLVGRLYRDEREVGLVLVLMQSYSGHVGGHLWWRRWSTPEDALNLWSVIHGEFSDHWVPPVPGDDGLDQELADYDAGRFPYYGESLRVAWPDADESRRLREKHCNA